MKIFNFVVFAMIFLATLHQKANGQSSDLKLYKGHGEQISSDTIVPKDTYQIGVDAENNTMTGMRVGNKTWADKVCEGFNYRAYERLQMDPITQGMLVKMLKDTAHCKVKYLNVKKDLLYNSEVEPNTTDIGWVEMTEDAVNIPYIVYKSPYNGQEAVIAKLPCKNPQADLRKAQQENKLANNDDVYFTPDEEGISESSSSDANAKADANAEARVIVEYVPVGATNFQQYNQQCGCYQPYYPPQQQYCYTPAYNSGLFIGVQILFTFQWGGQTYNAYDPNNQIVQNIVNNYVTNNYVTNNYGTSDSTTTDAGGATNGNDGYVVDNGGPTNGSDGVAQNGNDGGGRKSDPNANQNGYAVETLESNPIAHNANGLTNNQNSNLASNVGNSVHNVETLDANPVLANTNVNGINHQSSGLGSVETLSANPVSNGFNHPVETLNGNPIAYNSSGNPTFNGSGINHTVETLDPNPVMNTSVNQSGFDANQSHNGLTYNQQNGNGYNYTASAANGTFNPQGNYSQGVNMYSHNGQMYQQGTGGQQLQGNNQNANTFAMNNGDNNVNGTYQNYNPNYNPVQVNNGNIVSTGNMNSTPRGNIFYNPSQGNLQQYQTNTSGNNLNTGSFGNTVGTVSAMPVRNFNNLSFSQPPRFNLSPSVQKNSFAGIRTF